MSEIGEIISPPRAHSDEDPECPFCPGETPKVYTTYGGKENNSGVLGAVMEEPSCLTTRQSSARPKQGEKDQQGKSDPQPYPVEPFTLPEHDAYSYEAHHLISGKQALDGSPMEHWLIRGERIERDTGYSVNNADNGAWLPSIPEKYKKGNWGSRPDKTTLAWAPMAAEQGQFHKGHHSIPDPDMIFPQKYDDYLKAMLQDMANRMAGWSHCCPLCEEEGGGKKEKVQPSVRVNQVMDRFSKVVRKKVTGDAKHWKIFVSRYALNYTKSLNNAVVVPPNGLVSL
ncbi:AHH domain-containing protein [Sorangium sp. So ce281]|uniref:AHH domain-containing protein n=1 Tax=unclassified Sorangium TaxID=2621164 RepID=UPI003F63F9E3